ncbi:MAG: hypothetical protein MZW92_31315 [Comamonadaceae bacterium]|nr:hypothetical protein [Comamonadaceae bacterium]
MVQLRLLGKTTTFGTFEDFEVAAKLSEEIYQQLDSGIDELTILKKYRPDIQREAAKAYERPDKPKVVGVYFAPKTNGWQVRFKINGKVEYFGYYQEYEDAVRRSEEVRAERTQTSKDPIRACA